MSTIFAQCSAHGKAGVAVFRISGPSALQAIDELIVSDAAKLIPRMFYFRKIYTPKDRRIIDEAMIVVFRGSSSFTGEDSVEIHTHGSVSVIKLMHKTLSSLTDVRLAFPGEFAKRSFLNGKMDLTAAEGLADLIDSETELQHAQAIRQLGGGLEKLYEQWRGQLIKIMGLIEAYIDFPDDDIPEESISSMNCLVKKLIKEMQSHLDDNNRGERLRGGLKLAIIGKPNVGKSSLLNYLLRREVAIVSNIAGTTRDIIEGHLDIGGYPIILQDTAGIHEDTSDQIEKEGIKRARRVAQESDIKIIMCDASSFINTNKSSDLEYFQEIIDDNTIIVRNKIDLLTTEPERVTDPVSIDVSIKNAQGLDELISCITSISSKIAGISERPQIIRARHRSQIEQALEYLSIFSLDHDLVLTAEDLRMTIRALSSLTGKITVDEILGEIFSSFCIGK